MPRKPTKTLATYEAQLAALDADDTELQAQADVLADKKRKSAAKRRALEAQIVERDALTMGMLCHQAGYTEALLKALLANNPITLEPEEMSLG